MENSVMAPERGAGSPRSNPLPQDGRGKTKNAPLPKGEDRAREVRNECSAGGVVVRNGEVLLVKVRNLQGIVLWTLPKGHLEAGETPRRAALREVLEETGYRCRILSSLPSVRYHFVHRGRRINKRVYWYRMEPEAEVGKPDAKEVLDLRWAQIEEARKVLRYPGDLRLIEIQGTLKKSNLPERSPVADRRLPESIVTQDSRKG